MRLAAALGGSETSCRWGGGAGAGVGVGAAAGAMDELGAAGGIGTVDGIGAVDGMKAPAKAAAGGGTGLAEEPKAAPGAGAVRTMGLDAAKLGTDAPDPVAVGTENPSS